MKKEIKINKFIATIGGHHSEEFDTYAEALAQIKEWYTIDYNNDDGWSESTREELRYYTQPVVNGKTISWSEFDSLESVDDFEFKFDSDFNEYEVDGVHSYIVDASQTYYVELSIAESDDYELSGTWSLYDDQECRNYASLDDLSECDVADFIKTALIDDQKYVRIVYAFDSNGNTLDCGTARGQFTAYTR